MSRLLIAAIIAIVASLLITSAIIDNDVSSSGEERGLTCSAIQCNYYTCLLCGGGYCDPIENCICYRPGCRRPFSAL